MQLAAAQWLYQELHEKRPFHDGTVVDGHFVNWSDTRSQLFPYHWSDGASIFMSPHDLGLGGDFLEQESVAQEPPGEQGQPGNSSDN